MPVELIMFAAWLDIVVSLASDTTVCTNERIVTRLEGGIDWLVYTSKTRILADARPGRFLSFTVRFSWR